MCNRYRCKANTELLDKEFSLRANLFQDLPLELFPMRNAAVVRPQQDGPGREGVVMRWGLVPSWAEDPKVGRRMTNAKCETVATKPSFRTAYKKRRCLIPATSFCEFRKGWYEFSFSDGRVFAFAGLWESWHKGAEPLETFTMLTGEPNAFVAEYHDRMPVIVHPNDYDLWLPGKPEEVGVLLQPFPGDGMVVSPV